MTKIFSRMFPCIHRLKYAVFVWSLETILPLKSDMVSDEKWIGKLSWRIAAGLWLSGLLFMTHSTCACMADGAPNLTRAKFFCY